MNECKSGQCGRGYLPPRPYTRQAEYFVRSEEGDSEPFDSYDDARQYSQMYGGKVFGRAKKITI